MENNRNEIENNQVTYTTLLDTIDFINRIKEKPFYQSWWNDACGFKDSLREEGEINYNGYNDCQKLCLYVYAWNNSDILPCKSRILKEFGWTNYKLQKIIKQLKGIIRTEPTFNLDTGLFNGRGYFFDYDFLKQIN